MNSQEIEAAVIESLAATSPDRVMPVEFSARYVGETVRDNDWQCDAWRVKFTRGPKSFETDYYTGLGHRVCKLKPHSWDNVQSPRELARWKKANAKPVTPHVAGVLHSLTLDASAAHESFADWCSNFGFNEDSISAFDTYRACCDTAKQLAQVFNAQELAAITELLQEY